MLWVRRAWVALIGLLLMIIVNVATVILTMGWRYTMALIGH